MTDRPILLLTNDDGVQARGLSLLRQALAPLGHVVVVAPTHEQSATSHAITIDRPLRHIEHGPDLHSIDGTPADCVYLALYEPRFLPGRPTLVVSGINHGSNLGTSVFYSGTIAGAREGALRGVPAVAFSHAGPMDAPWLEGYVRDMVARMLQSERAAPLHRQRAANDVPLLNVNFPKAEPKGVRVARVGRHIYEERVTPRRDPGGREYFWIGGKVIDYGEVEGSDKKQVDDGYVAVTALALEATADQHATLAHFVAGSSGATASD